MPNMPEEKILVKDELIGLKVTVKECTDKSLENTSGTIIDETKNTFLIETKDGVKRVAKNIAKFEFEYKGKKFIISGSRLLYRPENRIKKAK
jgi:ribonuclease P protein subunit POP4